MVQLLLYVRCFITPRVLWPSDKHLFWFFKVCVCSVFSQIKVCGCWGKLIWNESWKHLYWLKKLSPVGRHCWVFQATEQQSQRPKSRLLWHIMNLILQRACCRTLLCVNIFIFNCFEGRKAHWLVNENPLMKFTKT